ncbi:MAG: hypothetical protein Q7R95_01485, partial [bacterium]|nr:hypothetical protein [bacterium]
MSKKLKIIGVLILSFIVAVLLNSIFIGKSPKPNILFISSLPNKINAFSLLVRNGFKPFPTKSYTLTPTPFSNFQPAPTEP